jgi:hypothetical protein
MVENCLLYLYADDSALFLPVCYNDNTETSSERLQTDLDRPSTWSNVWKLDFKASTSLVHPENLIRSTVPKFASRRHPKG